jgi:ABC-type bacteriocin/lantibiotic exporter with double-glycine peptidase domain
VGDIYSNIVISAPQLTLDDAWEAAEMAGVADDIRRMPMNMFTIIGEGAGGISGGQKQVSDSLDALKCTRIVIAHRLSTIKKCDRIIVLDEGRKDKINTSEEY